MRSFLIIVLIVVSGIAKAQNYPVQAFLQVTPPYSGYLPDYSDPFNQQMKVLLTLNDFSVPSYNVKLQFSFNGNGYSLQNPDYLASPTYTLYPGVPLEISGADLAHYLSLSNLQVSGLNVQDYQNRKILPEGPLTVCVKILDANLPVATNLANPACNQIWVSLYDPPLLNTPMCGQEVTVLNPQFMTFTWMPLHMNAPGASTNTEYTFELFEIRPDGNDPNIVVNQTLPIYTTTTTQTVLTYGITEPPLQENMSYVLRVKASDLNGRDHFNNQGYSQVCTFTYGNMAANTLAGISLNLSAHATGNRQGHASWTSNNVFTNYTLEVRKTGNPNYAWFPHNTTGASFGIHGLEPETEYECRVRGEAQGEYSDWSNTAVFTTHATPEYSCGSTTMLPTDPNAAPLLIAQPYQVYQIGQFELMVTSISPSQTHPGNGWYQGTGKVSIPFALTSLNVSFDAIYVDEHLMVVNGELHAITDGIQNWIQEQSMIDPLEYTVPGIIESAGVNNDSMAYVVVDGDTITFPFPNPYDPIIVNDDSDYEYVIFPDGTVIIRLAHEASDDTLAATERWHVDFFKSDAQVYGFDSMQYNVWSEHYEHIFNDSFIYHVPWKSLARGEGDIVKARFIDLDNVDCPISFETAAGNSIQASQSGDDYTLQLPAVENDFAIYAICNGERIGKLNVAVYKGRQKNIHIVPLAANLSIDTSTVRDAITSIYNQGAGKISLYLEDPFTDQSWDLNADNKLAAGNHSNLADYSAEMRALNQAYLAHNTTLKASDYIVFIIPSFDENNVDVGGYMPMGRHKGYVQSQSTPAQTAHVLAHEIGHGCYGLEHTFPEVSQGETGNLMDYGNEHHLSKMQWDKMDRLLPDFNLFDDEEDGEYAHLGEIPDDYKNQADGTMSFLAPNMDVITLPAHAKDILFSTCDPIYSGGTGRAGKLVVPMGALVGFRLQGKGWYQLRYETSSNMFSYTNNAGEDYIDSLSKKRFGSWLSQDDIDETGNNILTGFPYYNGGFKVKLFSLERNSLMQTYQSNVSSYADPTAAMFISTTPYSIMDRVYQDEKEIHALEQILSDLHSPSLGIIKKSTFIEANYYPDIRNSNLATYYWERINETIDLNEVTSPLIISYITWLIEISNNPEVSSHLCNLESSLGGAIWGEIQFGTSIYERYTYLRDKIEEGISENYDAALLVDDISDAAMDRNYSSLIDALEQAEEMINYPCLLEDLDPVSRINAIKTLWENQSYLSTDEDIENYIIDFISTAEYNGSSGELLDYLFDNQASLFWKLFRDLDGSEYDDYVQKLTEFHMYEYDEMVELKTFRTYPADAIELLRTDYNTPDTKGEFSVSLRYKHSRQYQNSQGNYYHIHEDPVFFKPDDYVKVYYSSAGHIFYDSNEESVERVVPGFLLLYQVKEHRDGERLYAVRMLGNAVVIGSALASGGGTLPLIGASIAGGDMVIAVNEDAIRATSWGDDFLEAWNVVQLAEMGIGLGITGINKAIVRSVDNGVSTTRIVWSELRQIISDPANYDFANKLKSNVMAGWLTLSVRMPDLSAYIKNKLLLKLESEYLCHANFKGLNVNLEMTEAYYGKLKLANGDASSNLFSFKAHPEGAYIRADNINRSVDNAIYVGKVEEAKYYNNSTGVLEQGDVYFYKASNGTYFVSKLAKGVDDFSDFLTINGKVNKAGGKSSLFNSFSDIDNTNIPSKYLSNENRFNNLAKDPDQGFSIKASTRKEAMTGLEAESQNILSNIERGPKGIEFYDANRVPWDVKTPTGEYFNVSSIGNAIKKELTISKTIDGVTHPPGQFIDPVSGISSYKKVLLDCTYINESQLTSLRNWLSQSGLSQQELTRIIEINVNI